MKYSTQDPLSFGNHVRTLARSIDRAMAARIGRYGVNLPQYFVLRELYVEEGLTQRELCARLNTSESALVMLLQRMEHLDLVVRERDPHDRRKVGVYLSKKGRALEGDLHEHAVAVNRAARAGLKDADVVHFRAVLDRLNDNLRNA